MALADDAKKLGLGAGDIRERLPGHRLREEDHEVDRMPCLERHPDLGILLEPADARPVPGPRVDDHEGAASRIDLAPGRREDPHESIVHRLIECPAVRNGLPIEIEERRLAGLLVLEPVVAALAQGVPEQDGALRKSSQ